MVEEENNNSNEAEPEQVQKEFNLTDNLTEITPAQDFQKGKAFVAVPSRRIEGGKLITEMHVVTSDRKKVKLDNISLMEIGHYAERRPFLVQRWGEADMNGFLEGGSAPTIGELCDLIITQSKRYLDFSVPAWHKFLALWIISTYFHRQTRSTPYIHLQGNAESGKTKCLSFIAMLSFNGELSTNNTPSYMIRVIHNNHATCCLDEVEDLNKSKDDEVKTVLAMLNAGYKKGSFVGKSEPTSGGGWTPKRFEGYSPKVFAGISNIYHTLASRSVNVIMVRSRDKDVVNNELNDDNQELLAIRNGLYRALLTHYEAVSNSYANITDTELLGRSWEIWKPILALANLVDEALYEEMRELALKSEKNKHEVQTDGFTAPLLLKCIYDLLERKQLDSAFVSTSELYNELSSYDEENFGWLGRDENKNIRGKWLGNELRRSGVVVGKAMQMKRGGFTTKGYTLDKQLIAERLESYGVDVKAVVEEVEESNEDIGASIPF